MKLKTDFLSKILYVIIISAIVALTGVIIGIPWIIPFVLEGSTFYSIVNHNVIFALIYVTSIPTWIILWMTKRLARNIIKREPFSESSVFSLKSISLCALAIFICYLFTCLFISATLGIIGITLGAFMIALISAIIYRLVQVAVEIQKENELTI